VLRQARKTPGLEGREKKSLEVAPCRDGGDDWYKLCGGAWQRGPGSVVHSVRIMWVGPAEYLWWEECRASWYGAGNAFDVRVADITS